jgi:Mg2+ and Co2+ transporter CorA
MGLVRQRRTPTGGRPECGSAAGQCRRFVRLGLKRPRDEDLMALASQFDLHPLAIEDAYSNCAARAPGIPCSISRA